MRRSGMEGRQKTLWEEKGGEKREWIEKVFWVERMQEEKMSCR